MQHLQYPAKNVSDNEIGSNIAITIEHTWNQKQFTHLLKTNKGRIHKVEKVADSTGEVQDQTHWAAFSCPPKLKLNVSKASIKGKTIPLKANIDRQNTPPFNRLHCSVLWSIRGSLSKTKQLLILVQLNYMMINYSCFSLEASDDVFVWERLTILLLVSRLRLRCNSISRSNVNMSINPLRLSKIPCDIAVSTSWKKKKQKLDQSVTNNTNFNLLLYALPLWISCICKNVIFHFRIHKIVIISH